MFEDAGEEFSFSPVPLAPPELLAASDVEPDMP
jgi:hypothetical protein